MASAIGAMLHVAAVSAAAQVIPGDSITAGLPELEWGMPASEVEARLDQPVPRSPDGELVFASELLGIPSEITLVFDDSTGDLFSVVATPDGSDPAAADRILAALVTQYGEPSNVETRTERRLLFLRFDTTRSTWELPTGAITLLDVRRGSQVAGLSLIYSAEPPDSLSAES